MRPSPFDYGTNVFGQVHPIEHKLSNKDGIDHIGIGARSAYDYYFGSSMNLPIKGVQLEKPQLAGNVTGTKGFRPGFYDPELQVASLCKAVDPTNPHVYNHYQKHKQCNYGFARNVNNFSSPTDSNRFAQYRWG